METNRINENSLNNVSNRDNREDSSISEEKQVFKKISLYGDDSSKNSESESDYKKNEKEYRNRGSSSNSFEKDKRRKYRDNSENKNNKYNNDRTKKSPNNGERGEYNKDTEKSKNRKSESPKNLNFLKNKVTQMISDKNKSNIFIPGYDGPLLSLSLFNELQHNIFATEKIENEYKLYKSKFENKRYQSFYVEHQNDEWFKEKYDPESNLKWKLEKNAQCQKLSQKFQEALKSGFYRDLKLRLLENDENNRNIKILCHIYNKEKDEFEEKERDIIISNKTKNENIYIDISNPPYFGFDPDKMTLFLHQLPRNVSRWQILDIIKKLPGFISMSLSEPIKNQNYYRYCWVTFDSEANCEMGYETLNEYRISNDYKIIPIKSKSSTVKRIRLTPALFDDRAEEDLEYSKLLIDLFDKEKNIENNSLLSMEPLDDKIYQLDLNIIYLRRVHGFCYYCLEEYDDERMLATRCDNIHLRHYKNLGKRSTESVQMNKNESDWDKNFTRLLKARIEKGPQETKNTLEVTEELNKKRNEYCKENTSPLASERFVCNICSKMFKGPNFVYNHIYNKHMNLILEKVDKEFYEKVKYENYVKDPNKIYEKYKIISNMDEYLNYLNTIKNFQHVESHHHSHSHHHYNENRESHHNRDRRSNQNYKNQDSNYLKKKRYGSSREYRDLDEVETSNASQVIGSNRNLISYDDL